MATEPKNVDVTKLARVTVPSMDRYSYVELGRIREETGIGVFDDGEPFERKMAACEWLARVSAGQKVTFDDVYNTGKMNAIDVQGTEEVDGVDPTQTPAGTLCNVSVWPTPSRSRRYRFGISRWVKRGRCSLFWMRWHAYASGPRNGYLATTLGHVRRWHGG